MVRRAKQAWWLHPAKFVAAVSSMLPRRAGAAADDADLGLAVSWVRYNSSARPRIGLPCRARPLDRDRANAPTGDRTASHNTSSRRFGCFVVAAIGFLSRINLIADAPPPPRSPPSPRGSTSRGTRGFRPKWAYPNSSGRPPPLARPPALLAAWKNPEKNISYIPAMDKLAPSANRRTRS